HALTCVDDRGRAKFLDHGGPAHAVARLELRAGVNGALEPPGVKEHPSRARARPFDRSRKTSFGRLDVWAFERADATDPQIDPLDGLIRLTRIRVAIAALVGDVESLDCDVGRQSVEFA